MACSAREAVFEEVCSEDFLHFKFGERGYQDQLNDSIAKTGALAAISVNRVKLPLPAEIGGSTQEVVWVAHNFGFLGGSLGCAEGEKITRAFELGLKLRLPVVVQCRSGGARMQEGTSSLMQMAKVAVAVQALHEAGLPFISVLCDPTYGGVSASYAMQADVRIAVAEVKADDSVAEARIGFAGPAVILNTMCEANQAVFDETCPTDFQAASFVYNAGQVDTVLQVPSGPTSQAAIEAHVGKVAHLLVKKKVNNIDWTPVHEIAPSNVSDDGHVSFGAEPTDMESATSRFNYTRSRHIDRPQTQDLIHKVFAGSFMELSGDGKVGRDMSMRGGIAQFHGLPVVVIATTKGHTPNEMAAANYGMPSPHGYRTALRLMKLAEKFGLPVVTLVDTVGAWPTFACEKDGQSEAIATNLTAMAGLKVPIITLMVGEGGSGGALGICMGNSIAMLSGGYFGVISPEGAASILGRYATEEEKLVQFPKDCHALATAQCIYAHQLKELGVVDYILWEEVDLANSDEEVVTETFKDFPLLQARVEKYLAHALKNFDKLSAEELVAQRYSKYRRLGNFAILNEEERVQAIDAAKAASALNKKRVANKPNNTPASLFKHVAEEVVTGPASKYRKLAPAALAAKTWTPEYTSSLAPSEYQTPLVMSEVNEDSLSAKQILDKYGVKYLCREWLPRQKRVLVTDTTMRDAHQSLLATRVRTNEIVESAKIAGHLLSSAFSLEVWGGATFDVCMRFLDECPWDRLRAIRAAAPNVCLQMLIRGANAVGYTSYPDNVVEEFIRLAAENGMDVFRVFDCFNDLENMRVSVDAIRRTGKIAEVCLCYTGNLLTSEVYTVEYYADLAKRIVEMGADILCIKDMAGLLRPREVEPLMNALRNAVGEEIAIHFHTHATSSGSLATCTEMTRCGCNIIDFATASMADGTSQPSLNTFLAMTEGAPADVKTASGLSSKGDAGIPYLSLEPYDLYWAGIRDWYSPFESGMKAGTARVFEHQIPGGQYSNLLVQCAGMGLSNDQWAAVCGAYHDVNHLFGDIVKVTPSSKCVGDLALYLVMKGLTTADLIDPMTGEPVPSAFALDFPASISGFVRGDLGFPHRGFPKGVEDLFLRKGQLQKHTVRPGVSLPPVDFNAHREALQAEFGQSLSPEQAMSSLMYPQVFSDYIHRQQKLSPALTRLPSLVYQFAATAGDSFDMHVTESELVHIFRVVPSSELLAAVDTTATPLSGRFPVRVELQRVSSIQQSRRSVHFRVSLLSHTSAQIYNEIQVVDVKDNGGVFVFDGPMADPAKPSEHIGSPMGGLVDKLLVTEGQEVKAGDVLAIVSAMKMEVKVSAPRDGIVGAIHVSAPGFRVVEGALLLTIQ